MFFFIINTILTIVGTTLITLLCHLINNWYDFYKIILLLLGFWILFIILTFALFFLVGYMMGRGKDEFNQKESKFARFFLNNGLVYLLHYSRCKIFMEGKELLPVNQKYICVSNHLSKFDPLTITRMVPEANFCWVAKKELFKMFGIGNIIFKCNFLPLDRDNLKQGLRVINQSIKYIEENQNSIGIFPEGTRNKKREILLPLKPGSLKIAEKSKVSVAIIISCNNEFVAKRWPWRSTKVYIKVCKVFYYDEYKNLNTAEFTELIQKIMTENIIKLREEKGY